MAKTKGIMGIYTSKMEDLLLWNLLFQISSDFVTFENNFRDGFLNQSYVGLKGALDNFSLIPIFFFKKVEIFVSLEVYTYVVTAC